MSDFRLKAFYSVARNLSFTKAAQELFISQPAVTKHIQELESIYSVRLFERRGNIVSLTRAGEVLMGHCERILDEYRKLEYDMHVLNDEYVGELRLGASTTISQYILPSVLAEFGKKYPKMKLSLLDTNSRNVEKALRDHAIDLGMVEGVFHQPSLKYESFLYDELVPVVASSSSLAAVDEVSIEDFKNIPLVLRERGSGTLDAIESELGKAGLKLSSLNVLMHLGSTESIKSFLKYRDCMGIISISAIGKELKNGEFSICDIEGLNFCRHFCFVSEQGQETQQVEMFKRFMLRHLQSIGK